MNGRQMENQGDPLIFIPGQALVGKVTFIRLSIDIFTLSIADACKFIDPSCYEVSLLRAKHLLSPP
mgnify:CR=1 FL=1